MREFEINKPFEGDTFIPLELIKLKERFGLTYCIETGTQYGSTSIVLLEIFGGLTTIEADNEYFTIALERLKGLNITKWLSKSQDCLGRISHDNVLYYLDAHGCEVGGCALKEELSIIHKKNLSNVCIAIHDFKVPDRPDLGFDAYDYELCFEEIEPYLNKIYPNGFEYHYNSESNGANRGIIFIYPNL